MNSFFFERSCSYAICCGLALSFIAVSAVQAEEVARTIAAYTNANGYLEYTAQSPNETVSFDGGAPIVWGQSFLQNRANFNPYSDTDVLTVVNPLVIGGQKDGSRIRVDYGTTIFTGSMTVGEVAEYYPLKLGDGTAKFASSVSLNGIHYQHNEGTSVFCGGDGVEHTLKDLYLGTPESSSSHTYPPSVVIFDAATVNLLSGFHIGCLENFPVKSYLYATNSTVNAGADMNIGNNKASAEYAMVNGSLNVGGSLLIGRFQGSEGALINDGGEITVNKWLFVGANDGKSGNGGVGTLIIDGNGKLQVKDSARIGAADASALVDVRRGTVSIAGDETTFGYNSTANACLKIGEGASCSLASQVVFGRESGNFARFDMTGGSFTCDSESKTVGVMLGRYGVFRGTMTAGNFKVSGAKQEFSLGRFGGASGRLDMYGGKVTVESGGTKTIGWNGNMEGTATGIVSVAKSAVFSAPYGINLATGGSATYTSYGEINLSEGGVFETTKIGSPNQYGTRRITTDGGTFRVLGNGEDVTYLDNVNLSTYVGLRGVTFDTGNNTATVKAIAADGKSPGQIRKTGTGTLVTETLPQTHGGVAVQEGILKLSSGATVGTAYTPDADLQDQGGTIYPEAASDELVGANYLLHRWSFTGGSLIDSIDARRAMVHGDVVTDTVGEKENLVSTSEGEDISTYLDLGAELFGNEEENFTVEFWVRFPSDPGDGKLLAIGMKDDNQTEVYMNIRGQVTARKKNPETGKGDHGATTNIKMERPAVGVLYHYSIVFARRSDGRYDVTFRRKEASGNTHGTVVTFTGTPFSPAVCHDSFCFAATPAHPVESTRPLELDEVRIWKAALSDAQLTKNAQLGPDRLPLLNLGTTTGPLSVASGATFDLGGNTISYGSLTGAGTVSNGRLALTDTLETQGLTVGANGVLDLTQATVVCSDAEGAQVVDLVSVRDGGKVVGPVKASRLPKGYMLRQTESGVSAVKCGFIFIVK